MKEKLTQKQIDEIIKKGFVATSGTKILFEKDHDDPTAIKVMNGSGLSKEDSHEFCIWAQSLGFTLRFYKNK